MTAAELGAWLTARGWTVEVVSDTEVTASNAERDRRYVLANDTVSLTVGGDYWRIEHVPRRRR